MWPFRTPASPPVIFLVLDEYDSVTTVDVWGDQVYIYSTQSWRTRVEDGFLKCRVWSGEEHNEEWIPTDRIKHVTVSPCTLPEEEE